MNLSLHGDKHGNEHGFAGNILHVVGYIMALYEKGRGWSHASFSFQCFAGKRKRG